MYLNSNPQFSAVYTPLSEHYKVRKATETLGRESFRIGLSKHYKLFKAEAEGIVMTEMLPQDESSFINELKQGKVQGVKIISDNALYNASASATALEQWEVFA